MYMPNKAGKHGLKMQCLVDSEKFYIYNINLYNGKSSEGFGLTEEEKKKSVPTQATLRLFAYHRHLVFLNGAISRVEGKRLDNSRYTQEKQESHSKKILPAQRSAC
ncbi:unnamed protein product [Euphydryas editha]|uniref:PiggyBac transposable element-derived protein domain-containing protein n=1 Tax=Euphydryas editha TaxID=104508 RepID=A0AAU9TQ30_EUPED|nr:unnamed protein product [Euphydryas editha]